MCPLNEHAVDLHSKTYESKHRTVLESEHWGRSALMHNGEVIDIFDESIDAYDIGVESYGQGNFAVIGIGAVSAGYRVTATD